MLPGPRPDFCSMLVLASTASLIAAGSLLLSAPDQDRPGLAPQGQAIPAAPRIDYVLPLDLQPQVKDPHTIWYDDFDGKSKPYAEGNSPLDPQMGFGGSGQSMLCRYQKGQQGSGGRKVFFGDTPTYSRQAVRRGESFDQVYWRIYVKHQVGWQGNPAKMSRATIMASENWAQAMIAHVWGGGGSSLTLDPVSCIKDGQVQTKKYNDWPGMRWLGNRPVSRFPIHATEESGYWVLVESRAKLNTPGQSNGINQLWIDGRLECERRNLDFRGSYTGHGINAVFLEAYWNQGSPVSQSRWYDNFVISTAPIGPVVCPPNPVVVKTAYRGKDQAGPWRVQVAADFLGEVVVYQSTWQPPGDRLVLDRKHGKFEGELAGKSKLGADQHYYLRIQQQNAAGISSEWSRWHQGFKTAPKVALELER
jgi:hypothetical protein